MNLKERAFFTRYFALLLHAGLTVTQSLQVLKDQLNARIWGKILPALEKSIESGHSVDKALEQFPNEFPEFYVRMIGVGEHSGNLAKVMQYLQKQLEKDWKLVSKVKSAFIYPVVIMGILLSVSVAMLLFIIPRVSQLFIQLKIQLPLPTRILLGTQAILQNYWFIILGLLVVIGVGCQLLLKLHSFRYFVDRFLLSIPLAGPIVRNLNCARFSQILSTLLVSGVPLYNALGIASKTVSNLVYQEAITQTAKLVSTGKSLSEVLTEISAQSAIFPKMMSNMIHIGEKTGNLPLQTRELAKLYTEEVNSSVKTLSTMIEPILLVLVAGGVGGIALAIVVPLYQLPTLLHQ